MIGDLPDPAFWRGKEVLLTGHTGFKGAWLAFWLARMGARVTGFALPAEHPSLFEDAAVSTRIVSHDGDIRDAAAMTAAMRAADPEIVLHMAAQALVRRSYDQPVETFATNVMGSIHVMEAARHAPRVRAFVSVTTDKCYENREWEWAYRETDALGGHDPYSASKACAELAASAWRRSFLAQRRPDGPPLALATARAGNVIGGGDWSLDRLVPDCVRAFAAGRSVHIRSPHATRPWQHVLEPLCGYLLLAERLFADGAEYARAWNFGPSMEDVQPVAHVVGRLAGAWGEGAAHTVDDGPHPHEAGFLAVDPALARQRLNWRPRLSLDQAIEWTGRWYRQHATGVDAARLLDADIERYLQLGTGS